MKDLLKGKEAEETCRKILDQWYIDGTYNLFLGIKGWFKDGETYVAFDNTDGECWIEEFGSQMSAERWLLM